MRSIPTSRPIRPWRFSRKAKAGLRSRLGGATGPRPYRTAQSGAVAPLAHDQLAGHLERNRSPRRFTSHFHSVSSRETLERATLQRRLLLCVYGLGTNTGLNRLPTSGSQDDLCRPPLRAAALIHPAQLRNAIAHVSTPSSGCACRISGGKARPPAPRMPRSSGPGTRT